MPSQKYALESGGAKRLEITWKGAWKNGAVLFDGTQVGSFSDDKELKAGREFPLLDGSVLKIQLRQKFFYPELQIFRNGQPIPGSAADPAQRLASATSAIFLVAGLGMVLGLLAELGVRFLSQIGYGIHSIFAGVIFLILGFFVQRRSAIALGIAMGAYAIDGIFFLKDAVHLGSVTPVSGVLFRLFLLLMMGRGFEAIRALKEAAAPAQQSAQPQMPLYSSQSPPPMRTAAPSRPSSISFVAPAIPPSPNPDLQTNPVEAERMRIELSRTSHIQAEKTTGGRVLNRPYRTEVRTKSSVDSAASAMRFVAYRCEISETGIKAIFSSGAQRDLLWVSISAMIIRQLPTGPPWEGKILLDLIPATSPGAPVTPLRLFSTTYVNYSDLPQGHAPSSQENLRRLANFVAAKNPAVHFEPGTALFLQGVKVIPRFLTMGQFAEYDSRYS